MAPLAWLPIPPPPPQLREGIRQYPGQPREQARDSPCFLCLQDLLVVPCDLDGQNPPGRVGG